MKERGCCPLLIAQHNQVQSENLVVDQAEYLAGVTRDNLVWKHREEYIDLTVKFVVSSCPTISAGKLLDSIGS